jgi:hypothetical protein
MAVLTWHAGPLCTASVVAGSAVPVGGWLVGVFHPDPRRARENGGRRRAVDVSPVEENMATDAHRGLTRRRFLQGLGTATAALPLVTTLWRDGQAATTGTSSA